MPRNRVTPERRKFAKRLRSNQTSLEDLLWRELRAKRLAAWKFKRQVAIDSFIVDFVCFQARLIVEADGPLHDEPDQALQDARRDEHLRRAGFRVLRFKGDLVLSDLARVIEEILLALRQSPSPDP